MNTSVQMKRDKEPMVNGEYAFTREDFDAIAKLLHSEAGIFLPDSKASLVYSRLVKRLRALGIANFVQYRSLVEGENHGGERGKMFDALTTNVTRFFREPHHFDHLRNQILPPLITRAKAGGKVRIWSAGCSSGQEPYSIALTILSVLPDARSYDIRILATDISSNIVAAAKRAVYTEEEIADVPKDLRNRWTEREGDEIHLDDAVKSLVSVKELNLMGAWPMRGPFDAVFCRNVVIYFNEATQMTIWRRMLPLLAPDAAVYIGHSERMSGPAANEFGLEGITTYRRKGRMAA